MSKRTAAAALLLQLLLPVPTIKSARAAAFLCVRHAFTLLALWPLFPAATRLWPRSTAPACSRAWSKQLPSCPEQGICTSKLTSCVPTEAPRQAAGRLYLPRPAAHLPHPSCAPVPHHPTRTRPRTDCPTLSP